MGHSIRPASQGNFQSTSQQSEAASQIREQLRDILQSQLSALQTAREFYIESGMGDLGWVNGEISVVQLQLNQMDLERYPQRD